MSGCLGQIHSAVIHLFRPWQARLLCWDSDYIFWQSVDRVSQCARKSKGTYSMLCSTLSPKNRNFSIKTTEPVMAGADATAYVWLLFTYKYFAPKRQTYCIRLYLYLHQPCLDCYFYEAEIQVLFGSVWRAGRVLQVHIGLPRNFAIHPIHP